MKSSKFGVQVRTVLGVGVVLTTSAAVVFAAKNPTGQPAGQPMSRPIPHYTERPSNAPSASNMAAMPGMEMFQPSPLPTEKAAARDLQGFLDRRMTGSWQIRKIENLGGEMTISRGARIFVMDVMIDLKVLTAVSPRGSEVMREPWLGRLAGRSGENKMVRTRLTWIRKSDRWTMSSID